MREQDIICTVCPMGCTIHVTGTDTEIQSVTGFTCPRGEKYARSEFTCPVRTLTTTVRIFHATEPLLPVRVDRPIPKEKLFEAMELVNRLEVSLPVRIGDVLMEDLFGAKLVATANAE
jgi:CxxC motif-containing protein